MRLCCFSLWKHKIFAFLIITILTWLKCRCLTILLMLQKMRSLLCICGIHLFENKGQSCVPTMSFVILTITIDRMFSKTCYFKKTKIYTSWWCLLLYGTTIALFLEMDTICICIVMNTEEVCSLYNLKWKTLLSATIKKQEFSSNFSHTYLILTLILVPLSKQA